MAFGSLLLSWIDWALEGPLVIYALAISIAYTIATSFIQFRSFFKAWRAVLFPGKEQSSGDMTPFQAFVTTLSSNLGNGSVVGAATAVFTGGPGAGIWVVFFGLLMMAIRFAEVFASTLYGAQSKHAVVLGGPMLYLREIAGGKILAMIYAATCFVFGLIVGNAMQTHAIRYSFQTTWGIDRMITAPIITLFILYIILGGAKRIIAVSDKLVPVKVIVFFVSAALLIGYHMHSLIPALRLMLAAALSPSAAAGGFIGFSIMQAISSGLNLSLTATESGLGTAAVVFGFTGSKDPVKSGLLGMVSTFVSSLVCFLVALCIVISGVWDSGLQSAALTIAAFNTFFGAWGGWIVSFLSVTFGAGVLVTYTYVTRAAWLAVTGGKYEAVFTISYVLASFIGAYANDIGMVWKAIAIANGTLLTVNLFGLACLLPRLSKEIKKYSKDDQCC